MKTNLSREVKIALTAIVAIILLYFGIQFLKGAQIFSHQDKYYITFKNAKALSKSSTVYADGYNIGIVSDIKYDFNKPGEVVVEITVDDDVRIPKGSTAELSEGMLGGTTLNLLLSNNMRQRFEPGDTIVGKDGNGLMDMAAGVMPDLQKTVQRIDTLVASLNTLVNNNNIPVILENAKLLTDNLDASSQQLHYLLSNEIPTLTGNLNKTISDADLVLLTADGTIKDLKGNVIGLTDNYSNLAKDLNKNVTGVTTNLNGKINELELKPTIAKLNGTMDNLNSTVGSLNGVVSKINNKEGTIGLLLNDSTLYTNLNNTVGSANNLLIDLKSNPKRYVHFSLFGGKSK